MNCLLRLRRTGCEQLAVVVKPVNRPGNRDEHILSHQRRIRILQTRLPRVPVNERRVEAGKFRPRQLVAGGPDFGQQAGGGGLDRVYLRLAPQAVRIAAAGAF